MSPFDGSNSHDSEPNEHNKLDVYILEDTKLVLPSRLPLSIRKSACLRGVADIERRLRRAQMEDSLFELRRLRRVYASLLKRLKENVAGQGQKANTCSKTSVRAFTTKIKLAVYRYREARSALLALEPDGAWQAVFHELRDEDNRGPGHEEDEMSEGRR
ncbi:hypothetical protein CERSUDRAFT_59656, partial [Gelatoporia subvermispora B]